MQEAVYSLPVRGGWFLVDNNAPIMIGSASACIIDMMDEEGGCDAI